jgi:hypothetical protein
MVVAVKVVVELSEEVALEIGVVVKRGLWGKGKGRRMQGAAKTKGSKNSKSDTWVSIIITQDQEGEG